MISKLGLITAYIAARYPGRDRAAMLRRRDRRLRSWLRDSVPKVPAYKGFQGALDDLPIIDKASVMARFADFNTAGIDRDAGWAAFAGSKQIGDYIVGASTGTSGNRGLFVISQPERFRWLGTILAKALPGFWSQRHRVAVILPLNTPLYDSANQSRALALRFFDITDGAETWLDDLCAFDPSVVIAPPKILTWLVDQKTALAPRHIFSAAELCDPQDKATIQAGFQCRMGEIYMATEGLFAVSCAQGTLHLCEDTMHFELPQVGDDPNLREVIISDFSRTTQIMARYRMNDMIRLGPSCPCGSPLQAVAEVIGRRDDCFVMGPRGVLFTPDVIRNVVIDADRRISDYRVYQVGRDRVAVLLPAGTAPDVCARARAGLDALFTARGVASEITVEVGPLPAPDATKLRRVENRYGAGQGH